MQTDPPSSRSSRRGAPAPLRALRWLGVAALTVFGLAALVGSGGGGGGDPEPVPTPPPTGGPVTISGTADFASVPNDTTVDGGLVYGSTTFKPIRGATVEVLPAGGGAALATGTTSDTGNYSLALTATQPVIVRVRAELLRQGQASGGNWNFTVRDNTQGNAVYVLDSAAFTPAAGANTRDLRALSGWGGSSYTTTRAAGPFAILDVVREATQKVLTATPNANFPALQLMWSVNNQPARNDNDLTDGLIGTSFYQFDGTQHRIYILGAANTDTDEFDRTVVAHEFGHYFQSVFSRDDSLGGSHGSQDKLDMRVAFSEGWGNAWSGMALNTSIYADSMGAGQQVGFLNRLTQSPAAGQRGWYSEASVQYLMFQWHGAAGIGFTPIFDVLAGMRSGLGPDGALSSIHYFAHKLKQAVPAQAGAIDTALAGQSITVADALGSTEVNNGGIADALPIYKAHTAGLGAAQNYCVTDAADPGGVEFNKLGAQAVIRMTLPASGARTIAVTSSQAGSDPGFRLVTPAGAESEHDDFGGTSESTTIGAVSAGTYLVVLYDWTLTHGPASGTTNGRKCFNVTVNQ